MMTQTPRMNGRPAPARAAPADLGPDVIGTGKNEDLFIYTVKNVTLKKGSGGAGGGDPMVDINAQLQNAATLAQSGKIPEARKIYEDLLAKYPKVYQLEGFIARTYAAENNIPAAMEHLKVNLEKEPDNVDLKLLQAELLMESGDKAGAKALRDAIVEKFERTQAIQIDPEREITICCGSTEAMMSAMMAIINPGDEIVVFEPYYENYGPDAILSGATPRFVKMKPPANEDDVWSYDPD